MAATLSTIRDRVEAYLVDSGNLAWATATLDEGIRLALGEIGEAAGAALTLNGLDGASATTLETADESWLVVGAAGHAACSRALNRAEKANLGQTVPDVVLDWGKWTLEKFRDHLGAVKLRKMHNATAAPHSALEWVEEPPNWD